MKKPQSEDGRERHNPLSDLREINDILEVRGWYPALG